MSVKVFHIEINEHHIHSGMTLSDLISKADKVAVFFKQDIAEIKTTPTTKTTSSDLSNIVPANELITPLVNAPSEKTIKIFEGLYNEGDELDLEDVKYLLNEYGYKVTSSSSVIARLIRYGYIIRTDVGKYRVLKNFKFH